MSFPYFGSIFLDFHRTWTLSVEFPTMSSLMNLGIFTSKTEKQNKKPVHHPFFNLLLFVLYPYLFHLYYNFQLK